MAPQTPAARVELLEQAVAMQQLLTAAPRSSADTVELSGEVLDQVVALLAVLGAAACDLPEIAEQAPPASEARPLGVDTPMSAQTRAKLAEASRQGAVMGVSDAKLAEAVAGAELAKAREEGHARGQLEGYKEGQRDGRREAYRDIAAEIRHEVGVRRDIADALSGLASALEGKGGR